MRRYAVENGFNPKKSPPNPDTLTTPTLNERCMEDGDKHTDLSVMIKEC